MPISDAVRPNYDTLQCAHRPEIHQFLGLIFPSNHVGVQHVQFPLTEPPVKHQILFSGRITATAAVTPT